MDGNEFGKLIFEKIGLPFPHQWQGSWQQAYQLTMGSWFVSRAAVKTDIEVIPFSQDLDINVGRVVWIEDRGFIHYNDCQFSMCHFTDAQTIRSCTTEHPLSSLIVIKDQVVCGLENGEVAVYCLETLKCLFTYQAHCEKILSLFPFDQTWITVSEHEIRHWAHQEARLLSILKIEYRYNLLSFKCFNRHLFFDAFTSLDSTTLTHFALDLDDPQNEPVKITGPIGQHISFYGWGDQLIFVDRSGIFEGQKSTVTRFTMSTSHQYREGTPVIGPIEETEGHTFLFCFYRGNAVFFVSKIDRSHNEDLSETIEDPVSSFDRIQILDLKGNRGLVFDYIETEGIFFNYELACTVMGTRLVYLRENHEILFFNFLDETISPKGKLE